MAPWFYRALESVSMIASPLSTALTIYPCQIRVHQRWQSKLQLLTARKKEWWPATADSLPQAVYLTTVKHTALVGIEPTTFRSWVRRVTSCATEESYKQYLTAQFDAVVLRRGSAVAASSSDTLAVALIKSWLTVIVSTRLAFQRVDRTTTRLDCQHHVQRKRVSR